MFKRQVAEKGWRGSRVTLLKTFQRGRSGPTYLPQRNKEHTFTQRPAHECLWQFY